MRIATLMTMLAAPLALAACDASEEAADRSDIPMGENMQMDAEDMPMTQPDGTKQAVNGKGTVTAVDHQAGTITIDHDPIPAVNWPAMTMAFEAGNAFREQVAVGDAVVFEFRKSDAGNEITAIRRQ